MGGGGQNTPPFLFFLHHPKTAQDIKLKLSDFKDTPLRHILQVKPVRYILSCYHGNKITRGISLDLAPKKKIGRLSRYWAEICQDIELKFVKILSWNLSRYWAEICQDIELKFGMETKFGPLSSKTHINLQLDVMMTFLASRPFRWWNTKMTSLWCHTSKFPKFKTEIKR